MTDQDDTQPMAVWAPTVAGPRRTFDATYDRALVASVGRRRARAQARAARRSRVDAEVARILDEVADEWRQDAAQAPDAAQEELARGIGTAAIVIGVAFLIAVVLVFGYFGASTAR